MKRLLLSLAVFAAAACGRSPSATRASCAPDESLRRLDFNVTVSSVATAVRRDVDLAGLARVRGGYERADGGHTQGLTVVEHRLGYKTGVAVTEPMFGGRPCAWIASLSVDMTPGEVTIYVPSEYADASCEELEILAHERRHEEIHRRLLAQAAENMRAALAKADRLPTRGTPLPVANRAEAEKRFEAMVDRVIDPVYAGFKAELGREQAEIDTPENYARVTGRCSGWK
jgi:hypothetical protein